MKFLKMIEFLLRIIVLILTIILKRSLKKAPSVKVKAGSLYQKNFISVSLTKNKGVCNAYINKYF
ncbi:hypothetical protein BKH43_05930 [Helicobacter sp. 13S00401-1]|nr:hypothetical protein BKH43_05930 [Helicobacter sp. 13S00401-1]